MVPNIRFSLRAAAGVRNDAAIRLPIAADARKAMRLLRVKTVAIDRIAARLPPSDRLRNCVSTNAMIR